MIVVFAVIAAVLLLYVAVLRDLEPKPEPRQKKKPHIREQHHPIYFFIMLGLMLLPIVLSILIIQWNRQFIQNSFDAIKWHLFVVSWHTVNYVTWIVCGVITATFYFYVIFIKRYWILILAAVMQIGIFVATWFVWLVFNGPLDVFDSVTVGRVEYHLVQTNELGNGSLYLFSCEEQRCDANEIDYTDSYTYSDATLKYISETQDLVIYTDFGAGDSSQSMLVERLTIPLPDQ